MDIATLSTSPRSIQIGGKMYAVAPLSLRDLARTIQWIKDHCDSPQERVGKLARAGVVIDPALQREATIATIDKWPPRAGSSEWISAMDTMEGLLFLVDLTLRKSNPGLTEDDVEHVADSINAVELARLLEAIMGVSPDPKASKTPRHESPSSRKTGHHSSTSSPGIGTGTQAGS